MALKILTGKWISGINMIVRGSTVSPSTAYQRAYYAKNKNRYKGYRGKRQALIIEYRNRPDIKERESHRRRIPEVAAARRKRELRVSMNGAALLLRRERDKKYYARHRDEIMTRHRTYHKEYGYSPESLARRRANYRTNPRSKFIVYGSNARKRSLSFRISFKQFMSFWQKSCHYCGGEIGTIGLDRINNSLGYSVKNIVPCCATCNRAKLKQTRDEYIAHCRRVANRNP